MEEASPQGLDRVWFHWCEVHTIGKSLETESRLALRVQGPWRGVKFLLGPMKVFNIECDNGLHTHWIYLKPLSHTLLNGCAVCYSNYISINLSKKGTRNRSKKTILWNIWVAKSTHFSVKKGVRIETTFPPGTFALINRVFFSTEDIVSWGNWVHWRNLHFQSDK